MNFGKTFGEETALRLINTECKIIALFVSMLFYSVLEYDMQFTLWSWQYYCMLAGIGIMAILFWYAHIPSQEILKLSKMIFFWVVLLLIMESIIGNFEHAVFTATRLSLLIMIAAWGTFVIPFSEMMRIFEYPTKLLIPFHISHKKVALSCALVLRLIPWGMSALTQIQESATSRGLPKQRFFLLVPWLILMLKMSQELSDALDSRKFE